MTVRVVLADDHPMFRYGLRAVLDQSQDIEVVGEAPDGATLLALVTELNPDIVLTDLSMEGLDGVHVIQTLAERVPDLPVIALTMHADDAHVRQALSSGARGYLLKGADGDAITHAIQSAADGHDAFDPSITRRLVAAYAGQEPPTHAALPDLTPRERDVLAHIADGCRNHEIARRLGLSEKTIRNLTSSLLMKLQVPDRTSAALRARDAGLDFHH
jgi:DNA-binding NarL/FixJ family response regulator